MIASRSALGLVSLSALVSTMNLGCLGPELTFAADDGSGGGSTGSTGGTGGTGGAGTTTATSSAGGAGGTGTTSGPGGGGGSGGGGNCQSPEDCPDTGSFCVARTCEAEQCGTENLPADTALPSQEPGDCRLVACDGEGGTVDLVDDGDLPEDFNDCTIDLCSSGEPSNDPEPLDTPCGAGGTLFCDGAGQCTGCGNPSECSGIDDDCKARTCEGGVCGVDFTADGVAIDVQTAGDCQLAVCDGAGNVTDQIDDGDVPDDLEECTAESCDGGVPGSTNLETGIPCGEGPTCDDAAFPPVSKPQDICSGFGACVAQAEEPCPAAPPCFVPTCEGVSCGNEPSAIDVPCDFAGSLDGFCDGFGSCVECTSDDQCGVDESCDLGAGQCESTCGNGSLDGDETDTDCGGSCPADCGFGEGCLTGEDCQSTFCGTDLTCEEAKVVFITSTPVFANVGGAAGGDTTCQAFAASAGLPGVFMAWLSDVGSSPSSRFSPSTAPYRRPDGAVVASDWLALTSGVLQNAIIIDELGNTVFGGEVWTGTDFSGIGNGDDCGDWTSLAGTGGVGVSSATDLAWTTVYSQFCNRDNVRLYCFQQ